MAVETGAIFKRLYFDGTSSGDFGVYISGAGTFNAPTRDVEMVSIPGRNGALALDRGRFENIEVTYKAGLFGVDEADFAEAISEFRNFLCSRSGYVRLEDDYNPDEYRMAVYKSGLDVKADVLKAGEFDLVFDCKPQRWLKSGEEAVTIGEWGETETATGDIVTVENEDDILDVKSLSVALSPIQDLHGYDKPWSGGNGKNKIYITADNSASKQNVTIAGTEGNLTMTSTNRYGRAGYSANVVIGQTYTFSVDITKTATSGINSALYLGHDLEWNSDYRQINIGTAVSAEQHFSITFTADTDTFMAGFYVTAGSNYGDTLVVKNARLELGSTATDYAPYSNICPISGRTEVVTHVSPTTSAEDGETYTTDLGQTVYGGTLEQVGGQLTDEMGYIASYNGEAIGEPWLSDRDEYVAGTTPSIGAEVVYTLATPQTYQLTPQEVELLTGTNNVWSDGGEVTLEYGQNPNFLINPTLFESSPMLEATGSGKIGFNGYEIDLYGEPIGEATMWRSQRFVNVATYTSPIVKECLNSVLMEAGDSFYIEPLTFTATKVRYIGQYDTLYSSTVTHSGIDDVTATDSSTVEQTGSGSAWSLHWRCNVSFPVLRFEYGTPVVYTDQLHAVTTVRISGTTSSLVTRVNLRTTVEYDGINTVVFRIETILDESDYGSDQISVDGTVPKGICQSTAIMTDTPTIIDCDSGEAYKILNNEYYSLNRYIDLGSDLPKLASGANEITFDNTITELKVHPRWWKV